MTRHCKKWIALLAAAAIATLPGKGYALNGLNSIGVGVKSNGMGGVGIALPQDSFASGMNPAGMVYLGCRYDVELGYVFQDGNTTAVTTSTTFLPFTAESDRGLWFPGAAFNWNYLPCQSLGFAVYVNGALDTEYQQPTVTNPRYQFYNVNMVPSWSWKINCVHSIGLAVNVAWNSLRASGIGGLPTLFPTIPAMSLFPDYVTDKGTDWELGIGFRLGWIGQITRCFRLGATWKSQTWMRKFKKYQGLNVDAGDYDMPSEGGIGFAWDILPCVTLAADFVERFWCTSATFDHNSRQTNGLLWGGGVPGVKAFGNLNGTGFGWNNQPIFKVGIAWQALPCLTLRVGYNHGDGPIAWSTETLLNSLTLATIEDHITVGATWYTGCGELSAFYWHGFKYTIQGAGSGGVAADQVPVEFNITNRQDAIGIAYGARY